MPAPMQYSTDFSYTSSSPPVIAGDVVSAFDSIYAAVTGRNPQAVQYQTTQAANPYGMQRSNTSLLLVVLVVFVVWRLAK